MTPPERLRARLAQPGFVVMNGGVAEQIGTPLDVYREPASVFVAGFIGSPAMNFLPSALADGGGSVTLDGSGQSVPVPLPASTSDGGVTVGIRPEHLEPTSREAASLELAGGREAPTMTVRIEGAMRVAAGDALHLALAPERVHLFDSASGRRLG